MLLIPEQQRRAPLTQHAFVGLRQTHILLCKGQHKADHKDLHAVRHQRQPQDKVESPLELSVAALLQDALVLLGQLLLVFPPLALVGRQVPELLRLSAHHSIQARGLSRVSPGDSLVLALVDLIILIVSFSGVTVSFVVIGPAVVAVVSAIVARYARIVIIIILFLEAFVGTSGVLVGHFIHAASDLLPDLLLCDFGDVLSTADEV